MPDHSNGPRGAAALINSGPSGAAPRAPFADHLARKDEAAEAIEQELLKRLVALNHERAEEEKRGLIR